MTVYFVSAKGVSDAPVKIGMTADLDQRLSGLQTSHHEELEVVASLAGGRETESYLHEALAASHIRGEWFSRTSEVEAAIARARALGASSLPFSDPEAKRRRFTHNQDIETAAKICRYILGRLYPADSVKFALFGVARRLQRYCPSMSDRRLKTLLYAEARRVDHFEMRALIALRDEVDRVERARGDLAAIPVISSFLQDAGAPFTTEQKTSIERFVEHCIKIVDDPTGAAR